MSTASTSDNDEKGVPPMTSNIHTLAAVTPPAMPVAHANEIPPVDLREIEMEAMGVATAGRALRAMSALTRRSTVDEQDTLDSTGRDDLAALFELLGEALAEREARIGEAIARALRR